MPRKARQTITGEAAQPLGAVPGQMYGMGVEQQRMQEAMPTPQRRTDGAPPTAPMPEGGAAAPVEASTVQGPSRAEQYQAALQAAQGFRGQAGILTKPTDQPGVPVTNGISVGPGAGPEILGMRRGTPTGRRLRELSMLTGDPVFRTLADRARL